MRSLRASLLTCDARRSRFEIKYEMRYFSQTFFVVAAFPSRISDKAFRIEYRSSSFNTLVDMMSVQRIIALQNLENNIEQ